jgi:hypothetical protein
MTDLGTDLDYGNANATNESYCKAWTWPQAIGLIPDICCTNPGWLIPAREKSKSTTF